MNSNLENGIVGQLDYDSVPLRALNVSCRRQLSIGLLPERQLPTSSKIARDWEGLCELAGFSYDMIQLFRNRSDPIAAMLEHWSKQQPSVGDLVRSLETMERFDIIEDIQPLLERDVLAYVRSQERVRQTSDIVDILPESTNGSIGSMPTAVLPITVHDVERSLTNSEGANSDKYDAYVSYIDSDLDFVEELIRELEGNYKLRLFIKERDMLPGVVESEADLCMINERCEKILLIVSQESLFDPHCEFQAVVAQAAAVDSNLYSKKVIPIICKPCTLPSRFKYLARLDYTKQHLFKGFWKRLFYSIKCSSPDTYVPFSKYGSTMFTTSSSENVNVTNSSSLSPLNSYAAPVFPESHNIKSSLTVNLPSPDRAMSVPDLRVTNSSTESTNELTTSGEQHRSVTPTPESQSKSGLKISFLNNLNTSKEKKKTPPSTKNKIFKTTKIFGRGTAS
ncbi:Myeloid differentiation primary response protein MyD88 [Chamberlinius hualienensis]